jgi:glucose dehydrogenase
MQAERGKKVEQLYGEVIARPQEKRGEFLASACPDDVEMREQVRSLLGDAWQRGGGSVWLTGSYDPELNLIIQGVGNPSPDWNATVRPGDNLYASSVIALDADTGKLKWHFQFVPHDAWDWDAMQTPVVVDAEWQGQQRKLLYWAHRDGVFYVLDRMNERDSERAVGWDTAITARRAVTFR